MRASPTEAFTLCKFPQVKATDYQAQARLRPSTQAKLPVKVEYLKSFEPPLTTYYQGVTAKEQDTSLLPRRLRDVQVSQVKATDSQAQARLRASTQETDSAPSEQPPPIEMLTGRAAKTDMRARPTLEEIVRCAIVLAHRMKIVSRISQSR